jgi:hypothetical protein
LLERRSAYLAGQLAQRPTAAFLRACAGLCRCDLDSVSGGIEHDRDDDEKKEEATAGKGFRDLQSDLLGGKGTVLDFTVDYARRTSGAG